MNRDERDELRRLHEAARPTPWTVHDRWDDEGAICLRGPCGDIQGTSEIGRFRWWNSRESAAVAVAARNALPALLDAADERDRLAAEVAGLKERMAIMEAEARHLRGGFTDSEIDEIAAAGVEACNRHWQAVGVTFKAGVDASERQDVTALLRGELEREDYLPEWISAVEQAAEDIRNRNQDALSRARAASKE